MFSGPLAMKVKENNMVLAMINVGKGFPVDVDIYAPELGEPAVISISQRFAWDDPAGAIGLRDRETGEKYKTDQQLIPLESLVDSFLLSHGNDLAARESLAQVFEQYANKLRLTVAPKEGSNKEN
jgi:hypothetical protein